MWPFKRILVTGGAGFVGSTLALFLKENYPATKIVCLDNLRRRGSESNLPRLIEGGVEFLHGDVRNMDDLAQVGDFDLLIECSAEPSVLAGYDSPRYMVDTNLTGAANCLEVCRQRGAAFFFISTSRVYSIPALADINLEETPARLIPAMTQNQPGITQKGISEAFSTAGPKSLYGGAKFSAEIITEEYGALGVDYLINRCSILCGPWQMGKIDQGVITFWLMRHYFKKPLAYIGFGGTGKQVRDFLDIDDYVRLVALELTNFDKLKGRVFNVGGGVERSLSLCELTKLCEEITGNTLSIATEPQNRPGDIPYFVSDASLIKSVLSWEPAIAAEETLRRIHDWIKTHEVLARSL